MSNTISGNYIGTDASGTEAIGNAHDGVAIWDSQYNVIGGDTEGERNLISGNGNNGVSISGSGAMSNTISGNYIGTDVNGTTDLGNSGCGVSIHGDARYNVIGGSTAGERNVISGNSDNGVSISGSGAMSNTISGNYIGTDASGTEAIGNVYDGVGIWDGAQGNVIGEGNVIAYNSANGVGVDGYTTLLNTITRNSIHSNTNKGIENSNGGNLELAPPIIQSANSNTVSGLAVPNSTVEVFSDNYEEGRLYEGKTTADSNGDFSFTKEGGLTGPYVTATATDAEGNTSEFSDPRLIGTAPSPIVTAIEPNSGYNNQNTNVTITGTNFVETPSASLDGNSLTDLSFVDSTKLLAVVPANLSPGTYDLTVTNPDGGSGTLLSAFTVLSPANPDVLSIAPTTGPNDVPVDLDIFGFNFAPDATATLDSTPLEGVTFVNSTHLRATVPAGLEAKTYDLTVTNPGGGSDTLEDAYEVVEATENDDLWATGSNLWTDPTTIRATQPISLFLTVNRQGGKNPVQVEVDFYEGEPDGGNLIGRGTILLLSPRSSENTSRVGWTPPGEGEYTLYAVIDPDDAVEETNEVNNVISRTVTALESLPAERDQMAPHVDSFFINDGAETTDVPQVELDASATDHAQAGASPSGVASLLYIEFEYSQGTGQWVWVKHSGWVDYETAREDYSWHLLPVAGVKYVQCWASDGEGNISQYPYRAWINYIPPSEHVARDQVRFYRVYIEAGQRLSVRVTPISGDPDLYIWPPDWQTGMPPWVSNLYGMEVDELSFDAPVSGTYQVEVYGYTAADYQITIEVTSGAMAEEGVRGGEDASKPERTEPVVHPASEPGTQVGVPSAPARRYEVYLPVVMRGY